MSFRQPQNEGVCLRFPDDFPPHPTFSHEVAAQMLLRAIQLSMQVAFTWQFIDKPTDGQLILLFMVPQLPFPIDGLRYLEQEQRYNIPLGNNRELEVIEARFGFLPNSGETTASRVRRRYRLHKGGHPQLVLVHYSRGQSLAIPPHLVNQPTRAYPLRTLNEPPVNVFGDKGPAARQNGAPMPSPAQAPPMPFGARGDPQALLAHQNREMEALERRSMRERSLSTTQMSQMQQAQRQAPPQARDEEDPADDLEHISTRTLAMTRYKRNHELMNEVFMFAAFGDKHTEKPPPPYSIFDKAKLEDDASKLTAEIEQLHAKAAARRALQAEAKTPDPDTSMASADVSFSVEAPPLDGGDMLVT